MNEEKMKVLQMVEDGNITALEGLELLEAMEETLPSKKSSLASLKKFLRVRISSEKGKKVNVNLPLGLLKLATKFCSIGNAFIPKEARLQLEKQGIDLAEIDFEELVGLIEQGGNDGKLVDIEAEDDDEGLVSIQVYIE
ncbi:MAG TPA: hypothetical protein VJ036_08110 [bacterium]|jgi:hypothetical protein|nr:hypothetical protein [bacterium]